jgi:hypothetical protein
MRRHLTYANVVSTLCLFVLLGGSAYAANKVGSKQIADNSVQGKDIKNGSITGKDVKRRSLTAGLFKAGQLPRGATGPQGPQGAQGAPGTPATTLFASVNVNGALNFGSGVTDTSGANGSYTVTFDRSLTRCALEVTPGFGTPAPGLNNANPNTSAGSANTSGPNSVAVRIQDTTAKAPVGSSFFLAVFC